MPTSLNNICNLENVNLSCLRRHYKNVYWNRDTWHIMLLQSSSAKKVYLRKWLECLQHNWTSARTVMCSCLCSYGGSTSIYLFISGSCNDAVSNLSWLPVFASNVRMVSWWFGEDVEGSSRGRFRCNVRHVGYLGTWARVRLEMRTSYARDACVLGSKCVRVRLEMRAC
jgi:hypothetical protein